MAVTFNPGQANGLIFYINGIETDRMTASAINAGTGPLRIGSNQWSEYFTGLIDDVRIYDEVLPAAEVKKLAFRPKAYAPSPANGDPAVTQPLFTWTAGSAAQWHKLYLGTSPELTEADVIAPKLSFALYYYAAGLQPGVDLLLAGRRDRGGWNDLRRRRLDLHGGPASPRIRPSLATATNGSIRPRR